MPIKNFYALYEKDDEDSLVFVGTVKECMEFIGCTSKGAFFSAVCKGHRVNRKYYAYNVFSEDVKPTEKKCRKCGKVKPINEFKYIRTRNSYFYMCNECNNEYQREYRRRKNERKNKSNVGDAKETR